MTTRDFTEVDNRGRKMDDEGKNLGYREGKTCQQNKTGKGEEEVPAKIPHPPIGIRGAGGLRLLSSSITPDFI
jgi:hypothetical protein